MNDFESWMRSHQASVTHFLRPTSPIYLLTEMQGNVGDQLIWAGTERMLSMSGLTFNRLTVQQLKEKIHKAPGTLVVPGSGAFVARWHEWLPDLIIFASPLFDRIVILPSQYDPNVPIVRKALQLENVYPFARDAHSYSKIKIFGKASLSLDPALWAIDFVSTKGDKKEWDINSTQAKTILALRTDKGSMLAVHGLQPAIHNNDISLTCIDLVEFLNMIRQSQIVVTDRLHVVVAAIMLGNQVHFVDPYDEKISRYISYNFGDYFSTQLTQQSMDWLLTHHHAELMKASL
jgi:exopolysaccharide biosynthesis predicted pyruvyltransferase EpsI